MAKDTGQTTQTAKPIGSLVKTRPPFYPDSERVVFSALIGREVIIKDAVIYQDFETAYGAHDLALMLVGFHDHTIGQDVEYTTASSGQVIVDKVRQLIKMNQWPVSARVTKDNRYYDLV